MTRNGTKRQRTSARCSARNGAIVTRITSRLAAPLRAAVAGLLIGTPLLTSCATDPPAVRPSEPAVAESAPRPRQFDEVRAVWVTRTSLDSPAAVQELVRQAAAAGFNTLIVQVRGRGDALYRSLLEPRPEFLSDQPQFDPLQTVIQEAHARGLAVHAWVNAHLVWGPEDPPREPSHLVNAHPEWLAVPRALGRQLYQRDPRDPTYVRRLTDYAAANFEVVEGLYTSPSHPGVQERLGRVWVDLASGYDLDGIHHDFIRFATSAYDYSRSTLEQFQAWVRPLVDEGRFNELAAAAQEDPYAMVDALPEHWNRFRRDSVTDLVRRVYRDVKARRPDLVVSAAVLPDWRAAAQWQFQAWSAWLGEGIVDVAVPMAYTGDDQQFHAWIDAAVAAAGASGRVWAGVGGYRNPVSGTVRQIDLARAAGAGGVAVFSYHLPAATPAPAGTTPSLERIGTGAFQ